MGMYLKIIDPGPERLDYLPLVLMADDSEQQVRGYLQKGILYVAMLDGEAAGIALAIPVRLGEVELKAIAVDRAIQHQGIGTQLLELVMRALEHQGYTRVVLGTGNSSIGQIAFYQKTGFRFWKIERDYFTPERGYPEGIEENGIPLRDMVWFERRLGETRAVAG